MKKSNYIITISIAFWIILIAFTDTNQIKIPHNKIEKSVRKYLKIMDFELQPIKGKTEVFSQAQILKIHDNASTYGYIYVSRVNSCRSGGCSINQNDSALEFEFFDYFFITDSMGKVIKAKVFNYQATHGHEIMSKGWLKQFVGFNGSQTLDYGKDIEAISGATISAKAIVEDIEIGQRIIQNLLINNYSNL